MKSIPPPDADVSRLDRGDDFEVDVKLSLMPPTGAASVPPVSAPQLIMPGKDPGGLIITTLLGVGGASLGTYIGKQLGVSIPGEASGFITAVAGAFLILLIYRVVFRKTG